ncbi:MAG: hypothetical protein JWO05_1391 [Gemmatimonadetes bacterium]|nr:hypothetical protein [Gemmatimonadota bacterium]
MTAPRLSSAGKLLCLVQQLPGLSMEEIAAAISAPVEAVEACAEGRAPLPAGAQLALAELVLTRGPAQARAAHRLKGQAQAALQFERADTARHAAPPPGWPS